MKCILVALGTLSILAPAVAAPDDNARPDHGIVVELGASAEREITERTAHLGPALGVEIEPIENWLEIEFGASAYRTAGGTSWDIEIPFKKPFRLSSAIELMPGFGPTWTHAAGLGGPGDHWGAEAVLDLFFWRTQRVGWYLEPSYGIALGGGNAKSAALTAGLFFSLP